MVSVRRVGSLLLALLIGVCAATALTRPALADDAKPAADPLVADALRWYKEEFAKSFVEGDENFFDYYADTVYVQLGAEPGYYANDALPAVVDAYIAPWTDAGWTTSVLNSVEAVALSDSAVSLLARWSIETDEGEAATSCDQPGWWYVAVRSPEGWRVLSEFEAPCESDD